jgi:hypothetical protein
LTDQALPGQVPSGGPAAEGEPVLRNVVIHLNNEQPVLADLFHAPSPSDVAILCTNLRTPDGKRPVFIDQSDSTFLLPLAHVRFIEIPLPVDAGTAEPGGGLRGPGRHRTAQAAPVPEADLEIDEDFLRKIRDA